MQTQSALNNFNEFTMLDARGFAKYIGFTEEEVKTLCDQYHRDFEKVKRWYDGYLLENCQVYNPKLLSKSFAGINIRATGPAQARMTRLSRSSIWILTD